VGSNAGALVTSGIVGPIDNIVVGIDVQAELGGSSGAKRDAVVDGAQAPLIRIRPSGHGWASALRRSEIAPMVALVVSSDEDWVNWLSDSLANAELEYAPVTLFVQELP
jgi:hypothetical protein